MAEAALEVLASEGSRGLSHRAVDRAADLPPGSTSNYFRSRPALLAAALRRHVELDLPPALSPDGVRGLELSREQAKSLLLAAIDHVLEPDGRPMLVARYELMLESTRRPELHDEFRFARERFVGLAEGVLRASGCSSPRDHARQMIALFDGIALDQLLAADSALDHAGIERAIERQLETC